jgi:hypothetical protein
VLGHEAGVALEAAGREHERRAVHASPRPQPHVAGNAHERVRQPARVEPHPDGERIPRLAPHDGCAQPLEPGQRVVEPLNDQPLKHRITARAGRAEAFERPVPPDDAAREQHRSPRARALLVHDRPHPELAGTRRRDEPRHPGAGDEQD